MSSTDSTISVRELSARTVRTYELSKLLKFSRLGAYLPFAGTPLAENEAIGLTVGLHVCL